MLGLSSRVDASRALARQPCGGLLVASLASRFVCAISVSCVDRHTTTTFMPSAARLAIIKVPQDRSAMALAARSSEQVVLGSAGLRWGPVFSGDLRPLLTLVCSQPEVIEVPSTRGLGRLLMMASGLLVMASALYSTPLLPSDASDQRSGPVVLLVLFRARHCAQGSR